MIGSNESDFTAAAPSAASDSKRELIDMNRIIENLTLTNNKEETL